MATVILIGGSPATGKSTLAKKLSERYNCPWISTDFIRGLFYMLAKIISIGIVMLWSFYGHKKLTFKVLK